MLSTRFLSLACAVAAFLCLTAAPVSAQPLDKRTLFTFSGPVTLPGVTLPGGQYLFRLAEPNSSTKVVQVLSADGTKPYGLFFTLPVERLEPASTPEVRFMETAPGTAAAIRTWWYPGETRGYEFIFPKEQARRLAARASQPVLTTDAQTSTTEQTNTAELARVSSSGEETDVNAGAAPTAATPGGTTQEGQIASSSLVIASPLIPPAAPAATLMASTQTGAAETNVAGGGAARTRRARLPQTASELPLVGAVGTATLLSAASLRYRRTRQR